MGEKAKAQVKIHGLESKRPRSRNNSSLT